MYSLGVFHCIETGSPIRVKLGGGGKNKTKLISHKTLFTDFNVF